MKFILIFFLFTWRFFALAHDRVLIGVLTIEISRVFEIMYQGEDYTSYIPASYVKWIEQGGARAVPIWLGKDEEYYRMMLNKVNGILLPGGFIDKNKDGGYAEASGIIMEIATELNKNGDFFPLFGIGAGMDLMLYHTNNQEDLWEECKMDYMTVSLTFTKKGTKSTALYNSSSDHIRNLFTKHPIAVFNAKKCLTKKSFDASDLRHNWLIFALNYDQSNRIFISAVEHKIYPYYGVMFHPEKVSFEWAEKVNFPHTLAAVEATQYLANYFVNECRKNSHWFASKEEEDDYLIINFIPEFTSRKGSSFMESYLFRDQN